MKTQMTMRELPDSERPYERCMKYGPEVLSDAQLLAVLLKTGSAEETALQLAQRLLLKRDNRNQGLMNLFQMRYPDYMKFKGIGPVKAITLLCVVELSKRLAQCQYQSSISFDSSYQVAQYYMQQMQSYKKEHFIMLLLNNKNQLLKEVELSVGTVNSSVASPREAMIEALRYEAVRYILIHNHPSGDPAPSQADIATTKQFIVAGDLLELALLDHIIIGNQTYISMKELQLV